MERNLHKISERSLTVSSFVQLTLIRGKKRAPLLFPFQVFSFTQTRHSHTVMSPERLLWGTFSSLLLKIHKGGKCLRQNPGYAMALSGDASCKCVNLKVRIICTWHENILVRFLEVLW